MPTITALDGTGASSSPTLVLGYEAARGSRNIVHNLIGGGIGVTLIPPAPRSGTLQLFYPAEADAAAALALHARPCLFQITESGRESVDMVYIQTGELSIRLEASTADHWVVAVGYQEVVQ